MAAASLQCEVRANGRADDAAKSRSNSTGPVRATDERRRGTTIDEARSSSAGYGTTTMTSFDAGPTPNPLAARTRTT